MKGIETEASRPTKSSAPLGGSEGSKESEEFIRARVEAAKSQNRFIHNYVMALVHALLWVAALSFAAFFHLSESFTHDEALLLSTLVAYGAYLCESVIATVKEAAAASESYLDFRKAGLWGWIALNICVCATLSIIFLYNPHWIFLLLIILTAGWQKYMDGRIPPRLEATRVPYDFLDVNDDTPMSPREVTPDSPMPSEESHRDTPM